MGRGCGVMGLTWIRRIHRRRAGAGQSDEKTRDGASSRWSRRSFIKGVAASAVTTETLLARVSEAQQAPVSPSATAVNTPIKGEIKLTLSINDQNREVSVEPRTT